MNISRLDKIIEHFKSPEANPLTDDLKEYIDQLDYCRDLLKRFSSKEIWRELVRRYSCSRATAYNIITDTRRFFSKYPNEDDSNEFWKLISIERLEKLYSLALSAAETSRDYKYCADIQKQIDELRGVGKTETFDPASLPPAVVQFLLPGGKTVNVHEMERNDVPKVIELVEGVGFTVEQMAEELKQLENPDERETT